MQRPVFMLVCAVWMALTMAAFLMRHVAPSTTRVVSVLEFLSPLVFLRCEALRRVCLHPILL